MNRYISRFALCAVLMVLQIGDIVTTKRNMAHGAVEGNPLMSVVMSHLGAAWFLPKLLIVAFIMLLVWRNNSGRRWHLFAAVAIYTAVIANNLGIGILL